MALFALVVLGVGELAPLVRPAASEKLGMPRCAAVLRRAEIWSISASLLRAPARLTSRPSASPNQRVFSASALLFLSLSLIWVRRSRSAGSGRSRGQRRQLCS